MKFDILNRFTGAVQFTAEIECAEDALSSIKLGLAVRCAVKARANLAGANLADANLADANLAGAYLAGANLARANLADAYLAGANLADANLADANLAGAYLADANLADANLAGAYLAGANLARANLAGANLADAYLAGAKWRDGVVLTRPPIQIFGLKYRVTILDTHMQIGCELHSLAEWAVFDDARIARMDGVASRHFWKAHRDTLLAIAKAEDRS
jgi:uncharacterized protein YjbI with pentapeptide repeats